MIDAIFSLLYWLGIFSVIGWFGYRIFKENKQGTVILESSPDGELPYVIWQRRKNTGLTALLPGPVPHIYLDGFQNDRRLRTSQWVHIPDSYRLQLEGNFNETFNLYAVPGNQAFTLSVFTPDVMAVFQQSAAAFDVELGADTLNILLKYKQPATETALETLRQAAKVVLPEVMHQAKNQTQFEATALQDRLPYEFVDSLKLTGKRRLSGIQLGFWLVYIMLCLTIWSAIWSNVLANPDPTKSALSNILWLTFGLAAFPGSLLLHKPMFRWLDHYFSSENMFKLPAVKGDGERHLISEIIRGDAL